MSVVVRDRNGEPIPEVLPGYKLIPGFGKYEIDRLGDVRYAVRRLHRPIKSAKGLYSYVTVTDDSGKSQRKWVNDLVDLAFPN